MQIVIDISDETYNEIMDDAKNTPRNLSHYERIIANSTPLDKIRERIELEKLGYPPSAGYYKAIMKCLQIIDKYKGEREVRDGE